MASKELLCVFNRSFVLELPRLRRLYEWLMVGGLEEEV
jgi:hypothetical protein